jgi:hypothetical protein
VTFSKDFSRACFLSKKVKLKSQLKVQNLSVRQKIISVANKLFKRNILGIFFDAFAMHLQISSNYNSFQNHI